MTPANTSSRPQAGFVPNPKLRLREQVHELARYRQLSVRTEEAYLGWIRRPGSAVCAVDMREMVVPRHANWLEKTWNFRRTLVK
jgi:hypothetical protein